MKNPCICFRYNRKGQHLLHLMVLKANEAPRTMLDLCQKVLTLAQTQGVNVSALLDKRWTRQDGTVGFTCLHCAVLAGCTDLVKEFLQWGADPNHPGTFSRIAPIMDAASKGYTDIISLLLQSGARVNKATRSKEYALIFAARSNQPACLKKLIQNGADANLTSHSGLNALMYAAQAGSLECIKALIKLGGGDQVDIFGRSVLYYAAKSKNTKVFRLLTENLQPSSMDFSIAKVIVEMDNEQMLRVLIEHGFPVACTEENAKQSALHIAAECNSLRCMDVLLKSRKSLNLDLSLRNSLFGASPLHRACTYGNPEAVMLLMKHGADTDEVTITGYTPMFCCIDGCQLELLSSRAVVCICMLIRFGCDLEKPTPLKHQGRVLDVTPLEFALAGRYILVAKMLTSGGAKKFSDSAITSDVITSCVRTVPPLESENTEKDLEDLKQWLRQPQDLMFLSCIAVRNALKRNIEEKIMSLPLPAHMQEYLNIPVLDSFVETVVAKEESVLALEDYDCFTPSDSSDDLSQSGSDSDDSFLLEPDPDSYENTPRCAQPALSRVESNDAHVMIKNGGDDYSDTDSDDDDDI